MTIGDQPGEQINQEIDGTAMTRMFNLRNVFQLVIDRFDEGAFAQQEFVTNG